MLMVLMVVVVVVGSFVSEGLKEAMVGSGAEVAGRYYGVPVPNHCFGASSK